jgi:dihydrofolate reductase
VSRIVVHTFAGLDGVVDPEAVPLYLPYQDDDVAEDSLAVLEAAGALLAGRKTFLGLAEAWKPQTGVFADRLNPLRKYVVSTTLEDVADVWENSTVVAFEDVPRLKQETEGDLVVYGCGRLARTLLEAGLLDELRIFVAPVVAGKGTRLFDDPQEPIELRLVEAKQYASGAVQLVYAPA